MPLRAEMRISDIVLLLITEQIIDPSGAQRPLEKRGYVEQYVISLSTVTFSDWINARWVNPQVNKPVRLVEVTVLVSHILPGAVLIQCVFHPPFQYLPKESTNAHQGRACNMPNMLSSELKTYMEYVKAAYLFHCSLSNRNFQNKNKTLWGTNITKYISVHQYLTSLQKESSVFY